MRVLSGRLTLFITISLCLLLATLSVVQSRAATRQQLPAEPQAPGDLGEFVAFCPLSHRAPDDPLVHPNMPGMSHMHDFMGNVSTAATTTLESLLANHTTCDPVTDRSAYWVPTLYDADGDSVAIEQATIYYTVHVDDPTTLQPYPPGLKIIAGSATATTPPNPSYFKWGCLGDGTSSTSEIVTCPAGSKLELLLNFPDCWDGANLDSADHKSHMAYAAGGACPASHPVPMPRLQFKLRYATAGEAGMRLASGPGYTMHGDFFNAWEESALANRMNCLYNLIKCGPEGFPEDVPVVTATPTVIATPAPTATPTLVPTTPAPVATLTVSVYMPLVDR